MKLLLIADEELPWLWEHYQADRLKDIEMILACGDLDADYLSFLATRFHGPVVYVPGNHDRGYAHHPPEGCINADGRLVVCGGLRIVGLGGCMRYNNESDHQYTEPQMRRRALRLCWKIHRHKGFDILLTHAPAWGWGDGTDRAHRGFEVFNSLIHRYRPRLMAHGHIHQSYSHAFRREYLCEDTRIVNACGSTVVEL